MKTNFFIAYRHLIERKFQSIMSILGIAISLTVFIISLSISNGLQNNLVKSMLTLSPHINATYDLNFEIDKEYKNDMKKLENIKGIKNIFPIYETKGIVKNNDINAMIFYGTDIDKFNFKLIEGFNPKKLTEVLVGSEYASKENLKIGDKLRIVGSNNKQIDVIIAGIFKTGYYNYDSSVMLLPLKTVQLLMEDGDKITSIGINIDDPTNIKKLNDIGSNIKKILPNNYVYNWSQVNQSLLSAVKFEKFVLISILSCLIVISTFVISVILNMIIREKTNDIGILKSFGYKNKDIKKIFLLEAKIMAIFGIILSLILSPVIIYILKAIFKKYIINTYYISTLPISISIKEIVIIYILSYILIILSTIIPTNKAAKMRPNDAIKYNN